MFCALHNTINTFIQDLLVNLVLSVWNSILSSQWFYQGAEDSHLLCTGWEGYPPLTEKTCLIINKLKNIINNCEAHDQT